MTNGKQVSSQQQQPRLRDAMTKRKLALPCGPVFLLINFIGVILVAYGAIQLAWTPSAVPAQHLPSLATMAPASTAVRSGGLPSNSTATKVANESGGTSTITTTQPPKRIETESLASSTKDIKRVEPVGDGESRAPPKKKKRVEPSGDEGEEMDGMLDPEELKELQAEAKEEKWEEIMRKYPGVRRPEKTKPKEE